MQTICQREFLDTKDSLLTVYITPAFRCNSLIVPQMGFFCSFSEQKLATKAITAVKCQAGNPTDC